MTLVPLHVAAQHLRVTAPDQWDDVEDKLLQAQAIVLDRCNASARVRLLTETWTPETVPGAVQAAILVLLAHLYEHRGDSTGDAATGRSDVHLWAAVDGYLVRYRDPVVG
jgi:hypothetical protein